MLKQSGDMWCEILADSVGSTIQANLVRTALSWERKLVRNDDPESYTMVLDTGATAILAWDDQDKYLQDNQPANARVNGAQVGSYFQATSKGAMVMACLVPQTTVGVKRRLERRGITSKHRQEDSAGRILLEVDVVTAKKSQLRKQLAGVPILFKKYGFNLDIRQAEEGESMLRKPDPVYPGDQSKRMVIPISWDAVLMEWVFHYIPLHKTDKRYRVLAARMHKDLNEKRGPIRVSQEARSYANGCHSSEGWI